MDHARQVSVVEVLDVRRGRVDESRAQHIEALAAAEQARLGRPRERAQHAERVLDGGIVRAPEPAAEEIEQRALALVAYGGGNLLPRGNPVRQRAGDFDHWMRIMVT